MPRQKIAHISDKFRAERCSHVTGAYNLLELSVGQNFLQFFEPGGIVVAAIDHEGGHNIVFQKVVIDYQSAITQANRGQCFWVLIRVHLLHLLALLRRWLWIVGRRIGYLRLGQRHAAQEALDDRCIRRVDFLRPKTLTAANHRCEEPLRISGQHFDRDAATHRVAKNMGLRNAEIVHQTDYVVHHFHSVLARIGGFAALPVTSAIQSNDMVVMRKVLNRRCPHLRIRGPAVNQNDWFALPDADIPNANAVGNKELVRSGNGLWAHGSLSRGLGAVGKEHECGNRSEGLHLSRPPRHIQGVLLNIPSRLHNVSGTEDAAHRHSFHEISPESYRKNGGYLTFPTMRRWHSNTAGRKYNRGRLLGRPNLVSRRIDYCSRDVRWHHWLLRNRFLRIACRAVPCPTRPFQLCARSG